MSTAIVLFYAGGAVSDIERGLDRIRLAVGAHVVALAAQAGFSPVLAVTADPQGAEVLGGAGAIVAPPSTEPFHLGGELRYLVRAHAIQRLCCAGAGTGALLRLEDLIALRAQLEATDAISISNNYYSADLVAFAPTSALDAIDLPATDNPLPRLLHQQAGLPRVELARRAATMLDVDTPTDATVLRRHPDCPPPVRALGAWEEEQGARLEEVLRLFITPEVEVCIAGRVGAPLWTYLESQTACRVRVLSEERGMQAAGRDRSGEARTVLGYLYAELGPARFFERMGELGSALVLDSRVLFAHLGLQPTPADRFASDIYAAGRIGDPRIAEFTRAAAAAPIPVLLGGHTLVSGGLWAMVEAAWAEVPAPA